MTKLVLVRHGKSLWNQENKFTGWIDLSLSQAGVEEAKNAGILLKDIAFSNVFTSNLIRAQMTLFEIIKENTQTSGLVKIHSEEESPRYSYTNAPLSNYTKLYTSQNLNERFYGDLQGENKDEIKKQHGEEQVHLWRRSYDVAPPGGDALKDTQEMTIPYLENTILPKLKEGNILIAAHGNSLRAIVKEIEQLTPEEITNVEIPTGTPIVYEFNEKFEMIEKKQLE